MSRLSRAVAWTFAGVFLPAVCAGSAQKSPDQVSQDRASSVQASSVQISSLQELKSVTHEQAARHLRVAFEATVTSYRNDDTDLFVQDGDAAVYVDFKAEAGLRPGDRVRVSGETADSFRPIVTNAQVAFLGHGSLPTPVAATFQQLNSTALDCRLVSIEVTLRSADRVGRPARQSVYLKTVADGGIVDADVTTTDEAAFGPMLDGKIQVTGVATAKFDERREFTGTRIDVNSLAHVKLLQPSSASLRSIPFTPYDFVYTHFAATEHSQRVRVRGTLTYYQPGATVVMQDADRSLAASTLTTRPLKLGDVVEVSGFPQVRNQHPSLEMAEVVDTGVAAPISPKRVDWNQLLFGGNAFLLVETEGILLRQVHQAALDEFVLVDSAGHLFSAIRRYPKWASSNARPALAQIPDGAKVRVTGIALFYTADPFNGPVASHLLLRTDDDLQVIARPSLWNFRTAIAVVAFLVLALLAVAGRILMLERNVRRQSMRRANIEWKRSLVLEKINSAPPIAEVLESINQLLAYQMRAAYTWCELPNGETIGAPAPQRAASDGTLVSRNIESRKGEYLGTIHAVPRFTDSGDNGSDPLLDAVHLAALAIETSQLYSDLVYRSEHDQLTQVCNRFSLERKLDELIRGSRRRDRRFGLIYIDLNRFKEVNDRFGHRAGDLYLQQVTARLKAQLRPEDTLARMGGDEFAAVVTAIADPSDLEIVAGRLQQCFETTFMIDGNEVAGSASMGLALFPDDGLNEDALFIAADARMYRSKQEEASRQA